jgi:two-component system, sensor histidine kinase and response regulator
VLVAEDNVVNQEIASDYLAGLGCTVTIVENGLDAVAMTGREDFDVVLMDCQMPEMDGLSATQHIRTREQTQRNVRLPIIAATAHAFEEDRLRCLAAGMDGYLCKPFSRAQLAAALRKWGPSSPAAKTETATSAATTCDASASDTANSKHVTAVAVAASSAAATSLRTERPALYARLVTIFLEQAPAVLTGMQHSLSSQNFHDLKFAAHSLKSSSANVEAPAIADLCRRLEIAAKAEDSSACGALVADIDKHLRAFSALTGRAHSQTG